MNWVKKRGTCTLLSAFRALHERVKVDVTRFQALDAEDWNLKCCLIEESSRSFCVNRFGQYGSSLGSVTVYRTRDGIAVRSDPDDGRSFVVTVDWNEGTGACELKIGDDAFKLWQISKRALMPLMFD